MTADDIERAAAHYLDPDRFHIVLVSDQALIQRQVAPLGLGPLHEAR